MAGRGTAAIPAPRDDGGRPGVTVVEGADGHRIEIVVEAGGSESRTDTAPDGSWTRTDDDGRGTTTDAWRSPDGRTSVCTHFADGSWSTVIDDGAGTTVERRANADGTEFHQFLHHADGSWTRHEEHDGVETDASGDDGAVVTSPTASASPAPGR
jgi:hypothetical protein